MRWGDFRRSENVEDRTGVGPARGGMPLGGGMRIGGGALIVIVGLIFGINPFQLLGMLEGGGSPAPVPREQAMPGSSGQPAPVPRQQALPPGAGPQTGKAPVDPQKDLVRAVLGNTEDVWSAVFKASGSRYEPPKLVLFDGRVQSRCGITGSAAGPFYCPADRTLYLDTSFFRELQNRFGAPGDFAQAYVIAHEVGHHVQNLMGTMGQYEQQAQRLDQRQRNALTIKLELQADCYAGVWGFFAAKQNALEPGDAEEGIRAAGSVGDDSIQKRTQGVVVPDAFTHGSSAQRIKWFRTGFQSGDPRSCNTFASKDP